MDQRLKEACDLVEAAMRRAGIVDVSLCVPATGATHDFECDFDPTGPVQLIVLHQRGEEDPELFDQQPHATLAAALAEVL